MFNMEAAGGPPQPASQQCCNCSGSTARCWCVDCNEALCDDCVLAHRRVTLTRSHRLLNQPQEDPITGHSLIFPTKFCRLHPAEALRLFCFTCNQLTCRDCQLVAHKNHSFQFVSEALESLKKQLDDCVQPIRAQMTASKKSLDDMELRLRFLAQSEVYVSDRLERCFNMLTEILKRRMDHIMTEIQRMYEMERQGISRRKAQVKQLQQNHTLVTETADKAKSINELLPLLAYIAQVTSQVKELIDQDPSPPPTMVDLKVFTEKDVESISKFGKLEISWVPFNVFPEVNRGTETSAATSSSSTVTSSTTLCPVANTQLAKTSLPVSNPPSSKPLTRFTTGNSAEPSGVASLPPVGHYSTSTILPSNQSHHYPSSTSHTSSVAPPTSTMSAPFSTGISQTGNCTSSTSHLALPSVSLTTTAPKTYTSVFTAVKALTPQTGTVTKTRNPIVTKRLPPATTSTTFTASKGFTPQTGTVVMIDNPVVTSPPSLPLDYRSGQLSRRPSSSVPAQKSTTHQTSPTDCPPQMEQLSSSQPNLPLYSSSVTPPISSQTGHRSSNGLQPQTTTSTLTCPNSDIQINILTKSMLSEISQFCLKWKWKNSKSVKSSSRATKHSAVRVRKPPSTSCSISASSSSNHYSQPVSSQSPAPSSSSTSATSSTILSSSSPAVSSSSTTASSTAVLSSSSPAILSSSTCSSSTTVSTSSTPALVSTSSICPSPTYQLVPQNTPSLVQFVKSVNLIQPQVECPSISNTTFKPVQSPLVLNQQVVLGQNQPVVMMLTNPQSVYHQFPMLLSNPAVYNRPTVKSNCVSSQLVSLDLQALAQSASLNCQTMLDKSSYVPGSALTSHQRLTSDSRPCSSSPKDHQQMPELRMVSGSHQSAQQDERQQELGEGELMFSVEEDERTTSVSEETQSKGLTYETEMDETTTSVSEETQSKGLTYETEMDETTTSVSEETQSKGLTYETEMDETTTSVSEETQSKGLTYETEMDETTTSVSEETQSKGLTYETEMDETTTSVSEETQSKGLTYETEMDETTTSVSEETQSKGLTYETEMDETTTSVSEETQSKGLTYETEMDETTTSVSEETQSKGLTYETEMDETTTSVSEETQSKGLTYETEMDETTTSVSEETQSKGLTYETEMDETTTSVSEETQSKGLTYETEMDETTTSVSEETQSKRLAYELEEDKPTTSVSQKTRSKRLAYESEEDEPTTSVSEETQSKESAYESEEDEPTTSVSEEIKPARKLFSPETMEEESIIILSEETELSSSDTSDGEPTVVLEESSTQWVKYRRDTSNSGTEESQISESGRQDISQSQSQPTVSLYRLPVSLHGPGCPLPRFRLIPGDAQDEIYLEEVKEDSQPHVDEESDEVTDDDSDVTRDFTVPLSSPDSPMSVELLSCVVCLSSNASKICSACGRGYHGRCHIPPVGSDIWSEFICSLCQDLSDPSDPYSSDRPESPQSPWLSLQDQRRCESLLLHLMVEGGSHLSESGFWSDLSLMSERLTGHHSSAYGNPAEFVSDIRDSFKDAPQDETLNVLQRSFQEKLVEIFGSDLHPSLLAPANSNSPSAAGSQSGSQSEEGEGEEGEEEEELQRSREESQMLNLEGEAELKSVPKLSELRKRLKDFLDENAPSTAKRPKKTEEVSTIS